MKFSSAILTAASLLLASAAAGEDGAFPNNSVLRGGKRSRGGGRNGKDSSSDSSSFDDDMVTHHGGCSDPVGAVLNLFDCVTNKDSVCAAAGYDPGFQRFHNENFTGDIPVSEPDYWAGAFAVVDLSFDIKFTNNPSPNRASVRYIETVTTTDGLSLGVPATFEYPFNVTILQHEHVLVDVDDDCNFVLLDQYGDDQEQTDVEVVVADLLSCVSGGPCGPA
ncbi:unnamed protein product [Ectocarpus sp. 6 AP-2014]